MASQAWHIVQQIMSETLYGPMMYVAIQSVLSLRFETYVRRLVKHSRFQSEAFFLILREFGACLTNVAETCGWD